jgi:uncharacterized protein YkwD
VADVTLVARGVGIVATIAVFALLASSASAVTPQRKASIPGKRELSRAGSMLAGKQRPVSRRVLRHLGPAARTFLRSPRTRVAVLPRSSRRARVTLAALESSLLARVNSVRRSRGLRALTVSRGLTAAAEYHSRQMVQHGFFEHESRGGGAFWKRVERFYTPRGFRSWEVGENLAYGSPDLSAAATVRMWMNSPGHRDNLLSRSWREIGLGAVHDTSSSGEFGGSPVTVITADFGSRTR